jgi:hypothetical protein
MRCGAMVHGAWLISLMAGCGSLTAYNLPTVVDTAAPEEEPEPPPEEEDDEEIERADLQVNALEPAWGSNRGGSTVTITGGPFDATAEVFFQGSDHTVKGTVQSATEDALTVTVPATSDVGRADIRVRTETHEGSKAGAFTFWKDGTGKIGLQGAYEWTDEVGLEAPEDWGYTYAYFTEPTSTDWGEIYFAGAEDQCLLEYPVSDEVNDLQKVLPGAATMTFGGVSPALTLARDAQALWMYVNEVSPSIPSGSTLDLQPIDSDSFPRFTVPDAAVLGGAFEVTQPDIHDEFGFPDIDPESLTLTWTRPDEAAYAVAELYLYQDEVQLERLSCIMKDDGEFRVPDEWSQWAATDAVLLRVGRVVESSAELPHNNARSGMVGVRWVAGIGFPL